MKLLNIIIFMSIAMMSIGQESEKQAKKKVETVVMLTSAECGSCKERIEGKLNYVSGIRFAELDVPTQKLTVKYKTSTISKAEIKKIVSDLGYEIDGLKADSAAYEALPMCCKVGGMEGH